MAIQSSNICEKQAYACFMTLDAVFDYFRSYDHETYAVFACQGNEPTEEDVAAFEREIGFRLPEEFREFTMSPLGGLHMEVNEELWPRETTEFAIGPFWSFLYGLSVFGIAKDIPDWLDIRAQYREFREQDDRGLVPFLAIVGNSDRYCFDSTGKIVRWNHEEPDELEAIDATFSELLLQEIRALEERKERKVAQQRN